MSQCKCPDCLAFWVDDDKSGNPNNAKIKQCNECAGADDEHGLSVYLSKETGQ